MPATSKAQLMNLATVLLPPVIFATSPQILASSPPDCWLQIGAILFQSVSIVTSFLHASHQYPATPGKLFVGGN
jgi:hypothetical protein